MAEISLFANEPSKRSLAAGETLFSAGDTAGHMYGVVTGAIDVVIGDTVVETVEAGGVLGEMAILDNSVRSATARASEDTIVAEIDREITLREGAPMAAGTGPSLAFPWELEAGEYDAIVLATAGPL